MDGRDSGSFMDDQEARIIFHRQQDFIEICDDSTEPLCMMPR